MSAGPAAAPGSRPAGTDPDAPVPLVIDSAVAVKLVLPEELSARAQALVEAAIVDGQRVVGPPTVTVAALNAIYARRRSDELSGGEVDAVMAAFLALPIEPLNVLGLDRTAFAFARAHRLRSVDIAYPVVLAQLTGGELWTGDRSLFKAVSSVAPWVRWIGDFAETGDHHPLTGM